MLLTSPNACCFLHSANALPSAQAATYARCDIRAQSTSTSSQFSHCAHLSPLHFTIMSTISIPRVINGLINRPNYCT